jgi:hypothetical protein
MSAVSFNDVSEIAIVPDREWRTPTLMVSAAMAGVIVVNVANAASAPNVRLKLRREVVIARSLLMMSPVARTMEGG